MKKGVYHKARTTEQLFQHLGGFGPATAVHSPVERGWTGICTHKHKHTPRHQESKTYHYDCFLKICILVERVVKQQKR